MNVYHIKTTCCVKDPCPSLQGQGHTYSLKVFILSRRVWRYTFLSGLLLCHVWKDFKITWHKCLPHQDDVSQLRFMSVSALWHKNPLQTVTLSCIEGFWNNLSQMSITWQHCVASHNHFPSSKVKVTLIFWRFTLSQLEIIGTHIHVNNITLSCIDEFKNNLTQMSTTSRWLFLCKTYVPASKVKVTNSLKVLVLIRRVWRYTSFSKL
jgi:hypothetical protein